MPRLCEVSKREQSVRCAEYCKYRRSEYDQYLCHSSRLVSVRRSNRHEVLLRFRMPARSVNCKASDLRLTFCSKNWRCRCEGLIRGVGAIQSRPHQREDGHLRTMGVAVFSVSGWFFYIEPTPRLSVLSRSSRSRSWSARYRDQRIRTCHSLWLCQ